VSTYYPVFLNLAGKRCLVIGGGTTAESKALALRDAGAVVSLIARELTPHLRYLTSRGELGWIARDYQPSDLEGIFLVIVATEDRAVNAAIWEEAERRGILINAVDDPIHCNFILPANYRQGDLVISVSSSGKSPALASAVRDRIAATIGPEYGQLLEILGRLRPDVRSQIPNVAARTEVWRRIVASDVLDRLAQGDEEGAWRAIEALLNEAGRQEVQA
jgi:siroheme synthase-like protein